MSDRPVPIPVTREHIPPALIAERRWVTWRYVRHKGRWTKRPYTPRAGTLASSTNPRTWRSFDEALRDYERRACDGIGFCLGDGWVGVDLDHCTAGRDLPAWAQQAVELLASYTETSPSGRGIHILCRGALPPGGRKKAAIEMYDRGRYFTVTGARRNGHGIEERSAELAALHARMFGPGGRPAAPAPTPLPANDAVPHANDALPHADDALIDQLKRSGNPRFARLWAGNTAGYASASEADLALCAILARRTRDRARIDRLFRQSGLYRLKWERADYRQRTLDVALGVGPPQGPKGPPPGQAALPPGPEGPPPGEPDPSLRLTDVGNAARFAAQHAGRLLHVHEWGWLAWDGARWQLDKTGAVMRAARETVASLYREADALEREAATLIPALEQAAHDGDKVRQEALEAQRRALQSQADALLRWATKSEARYPLESMVSLAQSEPALVARVEDFDRDPWALNCTNGTLDLRALSLRPHEPRDRITRLCGTAWVPDAACPRWERFLGEIFLGDREVIDFCQRRVGYSLTGVTREKEFALLYGTGDNGKSTFTDVLQKLLGSYATQTRAETLLEKRFGGGVPNDVAALAGARVVVASELPEGAALNEGLVKDLTGVTDKISARFLHREFFEFVPEFKLWLYGNHKPHVRGTDNALWGRVNLIPFEASFPKGDPRRDETLPIKLAAELPGILAWAVAGCRLWQAGGLRVAGKIREASREYRDQENWLAPFLQECCVEGPDRVVTRNDLYQAYACWAAASGEAVRSKKKMGSEMLATGRFGDSAFRDTAGERAWRGLGLRQPIDRSGQRNGHI